MKENAVKIMTVVVLYTLVLLGLRKINLKRFIRGRQVLCLWLSPVIGTAGVVAAYLYYSDVQLRLSTTKFAGSEAVVLNILIAVAFLVLKLILLPICKGVWKDNNLMGRTCDSCYSFDGGYGNWFLMEKYVNLRKGLSAVSFVLTAVSAVMMTLGWIGGKFVNLRMAVFPMFAVIIVTELFNFYNGVTLPEYMTDVGGEDIRSSKISAYQKLRKIFEKMFPSDLLVSHTGNEFGQKQGATELIEDLCSSGDEKDRLVGNYFDHHKLKNGFFDVDMVNMTNALIHGKSTIVFNPFYRDMGDYLLFPMVNALINNKKCLIIVGRNSLKEDVAEWAAETLRRYSRSKNLWRVGTVSQEENDFEVGIVSFSQLYDLKTISSGRDFFKKSGVILLIEPSRMITTSQTGLEIIAKNTDTAEKPVYCVCDHNEDGLVDILSHVLQTEITEVSASPVPRSTYTGMAWSASGDYARQKLFGKQTHYLGNGTELAAVALKNQVEHVSWYSEEKAPVRDIEWIAGQYYPQICSYAHLPEQQKVLKEKISFCSNLWGSKVREQEFVIAEDELCNLFATLRAYMTRGSEQSFVNVISENYLVRDYMRYNKQLFLTDGKAIPSVAPRYSKTERNTVFRLLMMMASYPVEESYIAHELSILGISTEDVYAAFNRLMKKYTDVSDSIITSTERIDFSDDFTALAMQCYSIPEKVFNELFAKSLKNAFFVVEDEKLGTEYIDARLFGHMTQIVMPGQFLTYDGKYYKVDSVSPEAGCILHRAADLYTGRTYYRQLRTYSFGKSESVIKSRRVMDIGISVVSRSFSVSSSGYLEMKDNNDLKTARLVDLSDDPAINNYTRRYKNKKVLEIRLPESDAGVRYTIALLMNELFRTLFPYSYPYIAVLAAWPSEAAGMMRHLMYGIEGEFDEDVIYVLEDSDMDLGLIEAVDDNLMRIFEILSDYLNWHFEKMREYSSKDPLPPSFDIPDDKKTSLLRRIANRIVSIFGIDTEIEEAALPDGQDTAAETDGSEEAEDEPESGGEEEKSPFDEGGAFAQPDTESEDDDTGKTVPDPVCGEEIIQPVMIEDNAIIPEDPETETETEETPEEGQPGNEQSGTSVKKDPAIPDSEILTVTDSENVLTSFDIEQQFTIAPTRYQKECYLKFGFDEIDSILAIENTDAYLTSRGFSNSALSKARRREPFTETFLDSDIENCCDFCGMPLSGVSYDMLADGRTRCNECTATAINDVETFRRLFAVTEASMEDIFNISIRVPVAVKTADARTIAARDGAIFIPQKGFTARVLGFAQKKDGQYSLIIENGSPRLCTIETVVHEMTHIWQYCSWDDKQVAAVCGMDKKACTARTRLILYEGMAVWAAVQYLYTIGETRHASLLEAETLARQDEYGDGFRLFCDQYPLVKTGEYPVISPFNAFPPVDPRLLKAISKMRCTERDCIC